MTETTVGREPVQIVRIRQPACRNTFGTSPCTASGSADTKCYNTRATCQDPANFIHRVEDQLGDVDFIYGFREDIPIATQNTSQPYVFALDVAIPSSPVGVMYEHSATTGFGLYLGWDSGGNLIYRVGNNTKTSGAADLAYISVSASALKGTSGTFYGGANPSTGAIDLYYYNYDADTIASVGSDSASFTFWTTTDRGSVCRAGGTTTSFSGVANGESDADFNGLASELRQYFNVAFPTMFVPEFIDLYFSTGTVAEQGVSGAPYIIPSLRSVSTTPSRINLSGTDPDAKPLGNRAVANITFSDHPHTDRRVDPYVSGRSWNPMDRGSFWSKWIVRNKYWNRMRVEIYEGYAGQSLADMNVRVYYITSVNGPDDAGNVRIQAKDVLTWAEKRKAQAPEPSVGELRSAISSTATSIEVANATVGDYAPNGVIRIGDELIRYANVTTTSGGVVFGVNARGYADTEPDDHSAEDEVQACLFFIDQPVDNTLFSLLAYRSRIPAYLFDVETIRSEIQTHRSLVKLNTVIPEPEDVGDLASEVLIQTSVFLWWDERAQKIKVKAIRGVDDEVDLLTAEDNVMRGISIERMPRSRISQVWFYYNIRNYVEPIEEAKNYRNASVYADLQSEGVTQYGEPSILKIYSRWLKSAVGATSTASRLAKRYRNIPRRAKLRLDAKDRNLWTGDAFRMSHYLDVDQYGERVINRWTVISAEEVVPGETVEYVIEDTTDYGILYRIQGSGAADYNGTPSSIGTKAYIGNSSGELSDGTEAAKIG